LKAERIKRNIHYSGNDKLNQSSGLVARALHVESSNKTSCNAQVHYVLMFDFTANVAPSILCGTMRQPFLSHKAPYGL